MEINNTIKKDLDSRKKNKVKLIASSAAIVSLLVLPLNLSPTFANSLSDIPIIGDIARVLTIKNYINKSETIDIDVKLPGVSDLSDKDYEDKINKIIEGKSEAILAEATERAREYKEAFIETGGSEEEFKEKNLQVKVDYRVFSSNENVLSFLVFTHESLAAVYADYSYYNINIKSNKDITLEDMLGSDYQAVITKSVLRDIEIQKNNEDVSFFEDVNSEDFLVRDDIDFYLDENNSVIVVFDKYEIAPGAYGRLEYKIEK